MVWFGKLNIPSDLVDAHREGRLVIFVGAGASVASPASLPNFVDLTFEIAREAGLELPGPDLEMDPPDVLLGRVEDERGVDVHGRIAAKIDRPGSAPNATHRALAALIAAAPQHRVVTTNYDRHLTVALSDIGVNLEQWCAPALPAGDDFEGLVYLHGSLERPPNRLVATDEDFGRAYLREAWATRFLEPMFAEYPVLFVGYSHRDVIMTYLGRGLRANSRRWIITDEPDSALFRRLRLTPIAFAARQFRDQQVGIQRWGELASTGLLRHKKLVAQLVEQGIPDELEDLSYLEATIADPVRVRFFVEVASGADWLRWAASLPEMAALFNAGHEIGQSCVDLAAWFARHALDESDSVVALGLLRDRAPGLHDQMWWAIAHTLVGIEGVRPAWTTPWLLLLLRDGRVGVPQRGLLEVLLRKTQLPADSRTALALLEHLLRPSLAFQRAWDMFPGVRAEIGFACEQYMMDEAWTKTVRPHLPEVADDLFDLALSQLRLAGWILVSAGQSADWLSYHRSAIEPSRQDEFREALDTLIDIARDSLEHLLATDPERTILRLDAGDGSHNALIRRLLVHAWSLRSDRTCEAKLSWLMARDLLWDLATRHEAFRLVAAAVPAADETAADEFVAYVLAGPPSDDENADEEAAAYQVFNAVVWILRARPELPSALAARAQILESYPTWKEREHPDMTSWVVLDEDQPEPSTTIDPAALAVQFESDPIAGFQYLDELQERDEARYRYAHSAHHAVVEMVAARPQTGIALIEADRNDDHGYIESALLGWQRSALSPVQTENAVKAMSSLDLAKHGRAVSSLLSFNSVSREATAWIRCESARTLATATWDDQPAHVDQPWADSNDESGTSSHPLLDTALNTLPGRLADFWLGVVRHQRSEAADAWRGLPDNLRLAVEHTLATPESAAVYARALYLSHIHVFWLADRAWCMTNLLPLLAWNSDDATQALWDAYLHGGRWNDDMLDAGLIDQYLAAAAGLTPDHGRQESYDRALPMHLAGITLNSTLDLGARDWHHRLTRTLSADPRTTWLDTIGRLMMDAPTEEAERQWSSWMAAYITERVGDLPLPLTAHEASAICAWLVNLDGSFNSAVELVLKTAASLDDDRFLLHRFRDEQAMKHPEDMARLIAHLLRQSERFFDLGDLRRLFATLKPHVDPELLEVIRGEAIRLNIPDPGE